MRKQNINSKYKHFFLFWIQVERRESIAANTKTNQITSNRLNINDYICHVHFKN